MGEEPRAKKNGSLSEALGLKPREMISLTGAGGKTTLMFRLARELFLEEKRVITTTTTKILKPSIDDSPSLFLSGDRERIREFLDSHLQQYRHITLAEEEIEKGKLRGISPELVDHLWNLYDMEALIIEADGAAGRPVKAPRKGEPVIPSCTTLVVAVLGMDGVGKEVNDQYIFQAEQVSKLTEIRKGERMTEEGMAILMTHPEGLFKGAPVSSRKIAFLNKVDILEGVAKAKRVSQLIFERRGVKIDRVVLGQLKREPPVAEVIMS